MASFIVDHEKEIELTFKIVITLASIGVVIATLKQVLRFVKKYLFYFADLNARVEALEKKNIKKRKPKGKTKENEKQHSK